MISGSTVPFVTRVLGVSSIVFFQCGIVVALG